MTIILPTDDNIHFQTFGGLKASISSRLDRDFEDSDLVDFIYLAEREMERVLTVPYREGATTLIADAQAVALPTDFKSARRATLLSNPNVPMQQVSAATLDTFNCPGKPTVFTIIGGDMWFGPVPDDTYTVQIIYERKISALTESSPTNWLIERHPDAYFYGALVQAADFIEDTAKIERYRAMFEAVIGQINEEGLRFRYSAAPVRMRSAVVV